MSDWITCPAGYQPYVNSQADLAGKPYPGTERPMTEAERQGFACANKYGTYLYQMDSTQAAREAGFDSEHNLGMMAFVAAGASVLILPGWGKLLALPLVWFGLGKKLAGTGF